MKSTYIDGGCSPEKVKVKDMSAGDLFMSLDGNYVCMKIPGYMYLQAIVVWVNEYGLHLCYKYGDVISYTDHEERHLLPKGHGIKLVRE